MAFAMFFAAALQLTVVAASGVTLVTFDGAAGTTFTFKELNDPVMGGKSSGTWNVNVKEKFGIFDGEVVDVPSLKAPGFIKAAADGEFPDASGFVQGELVLSVRTTTPEYTGFRVSFASGALSPAYACAGGGTIPLSHGCFKAKFSVPLGSADAFATVRIPFNDFSDNWSPATGEQTKTCADNQDVCPSAKTLAGIKRIEVWAEGVSGKVHLEVKSISADLRASTARFQSALGHAAAVAEASSISTEIPLVTFDGAQGTSFKFAELNDPVMGGKSTGTWSLNTAGGFGIFDGEVVNVPSLKAPGFIEAHADGKFADISAAAKGDLVLRVRSSPEYKGWKVSLASGAHSASYSCAAGGGLPFSRGCYKAPFFLPLASSTGDFAEVRVPFSSFTDRWSSYTGNPTASCKEDASTCLTAEKLRKVQRVELMAEGVAGKVHLEVKSISAAPAQRQISFIV